MKEEIKTPKTKGWRDSQPIRCIVQNTGNQDAHRIVWVWLQNRRKSEGYEKKNKGKCIGNQQWWEGNRDSSKWFVPEGINKHSTITEWRNKNSKNEDRLRILQDIFKRSNIWIIGVLEGEEEEQEIEHIMKENFPNLAKEVRLPGSPGSPESPKRVGPKEAHTKAHHNYITQD